MKIALKYGAAVTFVIAGWVALKHSVLHLEGPPAQIADFVIFNLAAMIGLTLGIKEKRTTNGETPTFGGVLSTRLKAAVTYAILTIPYLAILLALLGPKRMHPAAETSPVKAFPGVPIVF